MKNVFLKIVGLLKLNFKLIQTLINVFFKCMIKIVFGISTLFKIEEEVP